MTNDEIIVVLGCIPNEADKSSELIGRARRASELYPLHLNSAFVASGGYTGKPGSKSEAALLKEALVRQGVPESLILLEEQSRTTIGNAYHTQKLIRGLGINPIKIYLVTSCYHEQRAEMIFSRFFSGTYFDVSHCLKYSRSDENEAEKMIRDTLILDKYREIPDLSERERFLSRFI